VCVGVTDRNGREQVFRGQLGVCRAHDYAEAVEVVVGVQGELRTVAVPFLRVLDRPRIGVAAERQRVRREVSVDRAGL
jgi:hypothetical protein